MLYFMKVTHILKGDDIIHKVYFVENKHLKTLNFLTLGMQECKPLHTYSYAYTNFYLIHYVVSGCGVFTKNREDIKVKSGQIFVIKPGNVYTYTADEKNPWSYIWFSFDGELSDEFERLDDVMPCDGSIIKEMLEADKFINTRTEFLTGKLYEFMSSVFEGEAIKKDYVKSVSDFIKSSNLDKISVSAIASSLNLNTRYLSRLFKEKKGVTIQEYIVGIKIQKACSLLSGGFNVSETAKAVGYENAFSFSKAFKKHVGISPSQYKESIL